MAETYFNDPDFQEALIRSLVYDRNFLRDYSYMLDKEDFRKVLEGEGEGPQVIAELALDFWRRYREPIGKLLRPQVLQFAFENGRQESNKSLLIHYVDRLVTAGKVTAVEAIGQKVIRYKKDVAKMRALSEITQLSQAGKLD